MGQTVRILRRATALALVLTVFWICVRAAPLSGASQTIQTLAGDGAFVKALLQNQLPAIQPATAARPLWQRMAFSQSPLLCSLRLPEAEQPAAQPLQEPIPETEDEPPISAPTDTSVVERTLVPSSAQTYLRAGDVYVANRAEASADMDALANAPNPVTLGEGPHILIMHTHGSEAYTPTTADSYTPSDPYRTTDCNYNTVRVGEEMAQVFRQNGFEVLHDTTLYDYPAYEGSYTRSRAAVERWLTQYPSIQVVLDVHRDALIAEDGTIYKAISEEDGQRAAQVMLVVGTNHGGAYHPLWQENLTFATALQQQLLTDWNSLARPAVLRKARFNQDLRAGFLLVEVGSHGNTLQEALTGARLFAQSASTMLASQCKPE